MLLDEAKAAMTAGEPSPLRALYQSDLLVLDDLGAERPTPWALDALAALVQHRYSSDYLPMIVTSNYSPSQLAKRLGHSDLLIGQRIVSPLTENCVKVKLDRADLRTRRAA
jgi:DNA replication protein DnaC